MHLVVLFYESSESCSDSLFNDQGNEALKAACWYGNLPAVKYLIEKVPGDIDINLRIVSII